MEFKRARSDEQKDIRIRQIVTGAMSLYEKSPYDQITMAAIAETLSFTRANLYKYFSTKEEIFLYAMIEEMQSWIEDVNGTFENIGYLEKKEFSKLWVKCLCRHEKFMLLYSISATIIEKNVSTDKLLEYNNISKNNEQIIEGIIKKHVGELSNKQLKLFVDYQYAYMVGMYPRTNQKGLSKDIIEEDENNFSVEQFETAFVKFLRVILKGM